LELAIARLEKNIRRKEPMIDRIFIEVSSLDGSDASQSQIHISFCNAVLWMI